MTDSIFILEDDQKQANTLSLLLYDNYPNISVTTCTNLKDASETILSPTDYSLFIIDISLSKTEVNQEGLDLAVKIREEERYKTTPVIFITGYPKFIYKAVNDAHCYSYIVKPYSGSDVLNQINDIFEREDAITVRTTNRVYVKLKPGDIYYIESIGRYMHFHTSGNGTIISRQHKLSELENILPDNFIRCHRSYIVNKEYVNSISTADKIITLKGIHDTVPYVSDYQNLF